MVREEGINQFTKISQQEGMENNLKKKQDYSRHQEKDQEDTDKERMEHREHGKKHMERVWRQQEESDLRMEEPEVPAGRQVR